MSFAVCQNHDSPERKCLVCLCVCRSNNRKPYVTSTAATVDDDDKDDRSTKQVGKMAEHDEGVVDVDDEKFIGEEQKFKSTSSATEEDEQIEQETRHESVVAMEHDKITEDPIIHRLVTLQPSHFTSYGTGKAVTIDETRETPAMAAIEKTIEKEHRPDHLPDITSLFKDAPHVARKESVFDGLETHEIRSLSRGKNSEMRAEHRELDSETELPNNGLLESQTNGPYDSVPEFVNDQPMETNLPNKDQEEESSTPLPQVETDERYSIKMRSNGKVLE